jgi:hypothetical protein
MVSMVLMRGSRDYFPAVLSNTLKGGLKFSRDVFVGMLHWS